MLAERLNCAFTDGDAFHSAANKEKMHQGIPLTDEDRWPWLHTIRAAIEREAEARARRRCSRVRRSSASYRDILRDGDRDVYVRVSARARGNCCEQRLTTRKGHFFDPSLLQSQLDTLEEPGADEAITVSIELSPEEIVVEVLRQVEARQ